MVSVRSTQTQAFRCQRSARYTPGADRDPQTGCPCGDPGSLPGYVIFATLRIALPCWLVSGYSTRANEIP
jgi:hypothetical protein